jgi:hypothetical protein
MCEFRLTAVRARITRIAAPLLKRASVLFQRASDACKPPSDVGIVSRAIREGWPVGTPEDAAVTGRPVLSPDHDRVFRRIYDMSFLGGEAARYYRDSTDAHVEHVADDGKAYMWSHFPTVP